MQLGQLRRFGVLSNMFGFFDPSSLGYIVGGYPMNRPLPAHEMIASGSKSLGTKSTTLPNGVRIVSESPVTPGSVHMGVTLNAGTRDELHKNSGVVFALNKTFLKTNSRTNEQINYGMMQMGGAAFDMTYNQEFMNYYGHCLPHDTYDFLQMLSDLVMDEKTLMDEEAAQWRIDEYWKLRDFTITPKGRLEELWLSIAYGLVDYGMPLTGFMSNFQNLGYYYLNSFRKQHVTPDRMVVWGANIQSHDEFVHAVSPYFRHLDAVKGSARKPSKYLGGEYREINEQPLTHVSLSFKGFSRNQPQANHAYVLKYTLGVSGQGVHNRAFSQFHAKFPHLAYFEPHHATFEDSGNFRINLAAPNEMIGEVVDAVVKEISEFSNNVTDEEVARAKSYLLRDTLERLEHIPTRMIKVTRDYSQTGKIHTVHDLSKKVTEVTTQNVKDAAGAIFKTAPTLVVIGGNTHAVPSADTIHSRLK